MTHDWSMSMGQFDHVLLDQSRQQAVFEQLRQGILSGALPAGSRLPPTRRLAEELGVARQTVVIAYERLAAEGYTDARIGSGTFVSNDLPDAAPDAATPVDSDIEPLSRRGRFLSGIPLAAVSSPQPGLGLLAPGVPASDLFPATAWASCAARVLRAMPPDCATVARASPRAPA